MVKSALSTQVKGMSGHIPVFTVYITSASTTVSVLRGELMSECWYRAQRKGEAYRFTPVRLRRNTNMRANAVMRSHTTARPYATETIHCTTREEMVSALCPSEDE